MGQGGGLRAVSRGKVTQRKQRTSLFGALFLCWGHQGVPHVHPFQEVCDDDEKDSDDFAHTCRSASRPLAGWSPDGSVQVTDAWELLRPEAFDVASVEQCSCLCAAAAGCVGYTSVQALAAPRRCWLLRRLSWEVAMGAGVSRQQGVDGQEVMVGEVAVLPCVGAGVVTMPPSLLDASSVQQAALLRCDTLQAVAGMDDTTAAIRAPGAERKLPCVPASPPAPEPHTIAGLD
jgi:hypothetical protein